MHQQLERPRLCLQLTMEPKPKRTRRPIVLLSSSQTRSSSGSTETNWDNEVGSRCSNGQSDIADTKRKRTDVRSKTLARNVAASMATTLSEFNYSSNPNRKCPNHDVVDVEKDEDENSFPARVRRNNNTKVGANLKDGSLVDSDDGKITRRSKKAKAAESEDFFQSEPFVVSEAGYHADDDNPGTSPCGRKKDYARKAGGIEGFYKSTKRKPAPAFSLGKGIKSLATGRDKKTLSTWTVGGEQKEKAKISSTRPTTSTFEKDALPIQTQKSDDSVIDIDSSSEDESAQSKVCTPFGSYSHRPAIVLELTPSPNRPI